MVRAAVRLTTAGCRVFRSSVADAQSRVSSGSLARSLVGIYFFYAREVDVQWGFELGVGSQVASTDVNSMPCCAARFGSSGVRLGRSHNNFGVASLAGLP